MFVNQMARKREAKLTVDGNEKDVSTAGILTEKRLRYELLIEGLTGIPVNLGRCRLLFQQGNSIFKTSFCSVDSNGIVVIDESFLLEAPIDSTPESQTCLQECCFIIQTRRKKSTNEEVQTLGRVKVDIGKFIESETDAKSSLVEIETFELEGGAFVQIHATVCCVKYETADFSITWNPNFPSNTHVLDTNRDIETANSEQSIVSQTTIAELSTASRTVAHSENKHQYKMNNEESLGQDQRRAHYAANWIKANRMFCETYDNLEKPISMEIKNSLDNARKVTEAATARSFDVAQEKEHKNNTSNSISSSSDFELELEVLDDGKHKITKTSTGSAFENRLETETNSTHMSETTEASRAGESVHHLKQLEDDNNSLRLSLSRLQQELEESRNENTKAKTRISSLVTEMTAGSRHIDQSPERKLRRKDTISSSQASVQNGLLRQQSTYSEYLETGSKKSIISNVSGMNSNRSSLKSFMSRSSSNPAPPQAPELKKINSLQTTEEFEAERLAFAEKLVQKEEIIAKLQKQVNYSMVQLRQLEAGIDGLETRFSREISLFKVETGKRYQSMLDKGAELIETSQGSEKDLSELKEGFRKLAANVQKEVRTLEKSLLSKSSENDSLEESVKALTTDLEDKVLKLGMAEEKSTQLALDLESQRTENQELLSRTYKLEDFLASVKGELAELKADAKENETHMEELRLLNERVSGLEAGIAEYESRNQSLFRELEMTEKKLAIRDEDENENIETLSKENNNLKLEIVDLSEKLAEYEQEIDSLKKEANNQADAVTQCLQLDEQIEALQKANQELELHLSRRKRHIDELQGDLKELRLKVLDQERDQVFDSYVSNDTVSSHVDAVIQAERRYSDLEQILSAVQAERDRLIEESSTKGTVVRSLMKENKTLSTTLKRQQKENSKMSKKLSSAKIEISSLQAGIKSVQSSRSRGKSNLAVDPDVDIMQELVSAKVSLAEMDEKLIKVRRELHSYVTKNIVLAAKLSRLESMLNHSKSKLMLGRFTLRRKPTMHGGFREQH